MVEPRFIRFDLVVKHAGTKIVEVYPFDGEGACAEHIEQYALYQASRMAKFVLDNTDGEGVSLELRMLRGDDGIEGAYFEMLCSDDTLIQAIDLLDKT